MRKQGKKIKQVNRLIPLGVKKSDFEFPILSSLLAMKNNLFKTDHAAHLWVLADMCLKFNPTGHVLSHAQALKRIVLEIDEFDYVKTTRWHPEAVASVNILLEYIHNQSNSKIMDVATNEIKLIKESLEK